MYTVSARYEKNFLHYRLLDSLSPRSGRDKISASQVYHSLIVLHSAYFGNMIERITIQYLGRLRQQVWIIFSYHFNTTYRAKTYPRAQEFYCSIQGFCLASNCWLCCTSFPGGFYSDDVGYVATNCKMCPNGSFVPYEETPGTSPQDCRACPLGHPELACCYVIVI